MTDPFRKFSHLDKIETDLPPPLEDDLDTIKVPCKGCQDMLVKNPNEEWVHEDEILSLRTSFSKDYHRADPDIIDIEEI